MPNNQDSMVHVMSGFFSWLNWGHPQFRSWKPGYKLVALYHGAMESGGVAVCRAWSLGQISY